MESWEIDSPLFLDERREFHLLGAGQERQQSWLNAYHSLPSILPTIFCSIGNKLLHLWCKMVVVATMQTYFSESVFAILNSEIWRFYENRDKQIIFYHRIWYIIFSYTIRCGVIVYLFSSHAKCSLLNRRNNLTLSFYSNCTFGVGG